jgi:L-alanine-DL-glutamate epimerase-like enolase superfamily enzyme
VAAGDNGLLVIESIDARPLSVSLRQPFVIASGRLDRTRSVEVEASIRWNSTRASGWGEAACLPPVTREDQEDVLAAVGLARTSLVGQTLTAGTSGLNDALRGLLSHLPVARAGIESAVLDAMARVAGCPLRVFLGGSRGAATTSLETDITIPIADIKTMVASARAWVSQGFRFLKVKVGKDVDTDARVLEAIALATPGARLRVDANAGYTADEAIALARSCERKGIPVECWEQPCPPDDWDALAKVSAEVRATVVADESARSIKAVEDLIARGVVGGINLKLAKLGGLLTAYESGRLVRAAGLALMVGGMVETRLGMSAGAHLACALGGVEFVDLDTAWLLVEDLFEGGYEADGPRYTMPEALGLGVRPRTTRPTAA